MEKNFLVKGHIPEDNALGGGGLKSLESSPMLAGFSPAALAPI